MICTPATVAASVLHNLPTWHTLPALHHPCPIWSAHGYCSHGWTWGLQMLTPNTNVHHAHGHVAHMMLSRPPDVHSPTLASPDCHSCLTPAAKRPGSAVKRASSSGVGGRSGSAGDPTNIGTLRDSVCDDSSLMRSCGPALLSQHASLAHAHTQIPRGPHEHTVKHVHLLVRYHTPCGVFHYTYPVNAPCSKVMCNLT